MPIRTIIGAKAARESVLKRRPLNLTRVSPALQQSLQRLFGKGATPETAVRHILHDVREHGDRAIVEWTAKIDGIELGDLEVSPKKLKSMADKADPKLRKSMELAANRISDFYSQWKRSLKERLQFDELGVRWNPLNRVGVYAPGGTAVYPSTVMMTAIPAREAGVRNVFLSTPPSRDGSVSQTLALAAVVAGVDRVFNIGGAQAIGAMAYGTESVPGVDKICGPGNIFVTLAKKEVYGDVGIDALNGPTETVVLADDSANPALCAADLLAQAEHDVLASPILITDSLALAKKVTLELEKQLATLERGAIARQAIDGQGAIVVARDMNEAADLANEYAPEHMCLCVRSPQTLAKRITNAGGLFLGEGSPEVLGDYMAGPSHVMPTGGSARFSSPLGIDDFMRRTSVIALKKPDDELFKASAIIARAEGLTAHARAAEMRIKGNSGKKR